MQKNALPDNSSDSGFRPTDQLLIAEDQLILTQGHIRSVRHPKQYVYKIFVVFDELAKHN